MQGIVTQLIKYILMLSYHLPSVTCKFSLIYGNAKQKNCFWPFSIVLTQSHAYTGFSLLFKVEGCPRLSTMRKLVWKSACKFSLKVGTVLVLEYTGVGNRVSACNKKNKSGRSGSQQQPTFKGASSWPASTGITIPRRRRTDRWFGQQWTSTKYKNEYWLTKWL